MPRTLVSCPILQIEYVQRLQLLIAHGQGL